MFIVTKGFSGLVSGTKGQVITLKDKSVIKELLRAGYIEEYSTKNQNASELKKENDSLKNTIETLEKEIGDLKGQLEEANKKILEAETKPLESPTNKSEN